MGKKKIIKEKIERLGIPLDHIKTSADALEYIRRILTGVSKMVFAPSFDGVEEFSWLREDIQKCLIVATEDKEWKKKYKNTGRANRNSSRLYS